MPYPWSAHDILTAADLNAAINAGIVTTGLTLSNYTPVVTQSNTPTQSVEYAKYHTVAGMHHVVASVALTGAGTAAQPVRITLPVAATSFRCQGVGAIFDASASTWYSGVAVFVSTTVVQFYPNAATSPLGVASFAAALASSDLVSIDLQYV